MINLTLLNANQCGYSYKRFQKSLLPWVCYRSQSAEQDVMSMFNAITEASRGRCYCNKEDEQFVDLIQDFYFSMLMHPPKKVGARCEVPGGKMQGTGARYQCEATGNLRGWNVRGATDNWRSRCCYRM